MDKAYPTTIDQLITFMEDGWPEVRRSVKTYERFVPLDPATDDNPRGKALVFLGEDNPGVIDLYHITFINGVPKREGMPPATDEKFFSEEHAVRATWSEYCKRTPPNQVDGATPVCLVWRLLPQLEERPGGIFFVRSRYSCVWREPEGSLSLYSTFNPAS